MLLTELFLSATANVNDLISQLPLSAEQSDIVAPTIVHNIDWTLLGGFIAAILGLVAVVAQIGGNILGPKKVRDEALRESKYFAEFRDKINKDVELANEDIVALTKRIEEIKSILDKSDAETLSKIHALEIEVEKLKTTVENQNKVISQYGEEQKSLKDNIDILLDQIVESLNIKR